MKKLIKRDCPFEELAETWNSEPAKRTEKPKIDFLKDYHKATDELAYKFMKKYFGKETADEFINDSVYSDSFWIGDETRQLIAIGDYYFNLHFIIECLVFKVKKNDMFDYYDYSFDLSFINSDLPENEQEPVWNLRHWLSANKGYKGLI